ncbi:MAG: RidA family protein [Solirubrobacteraceae bacterium]
MTVRGTARAQQIKTDRDPSERFHIAQGYRVGDLIFVSGQVGTAADGAVVPGGFEQQAQAAFGNLRRVLEAAGAGIDSVIKLNIYVTDMANFPSIVELRAEHFSVPYPADTIVEVSALARPGLMIEIEAVALAE